MEVQPQANDSQCKTQTADYCLHHTNEHLTKIVPLFSDPKNNSPQSVCRLHFTLPHTKLNFTVQDVVQLTFWNGPVHISITLTQSSGQMPSPKKGDCRLWIKNLGESSRNVKVYKVRHISPHNNFINHMYYQSSDIRVIVTCFLTYYFMSPLFLTTCKLK